MYDPGFTQKRNMTLLRTHVRSYWTMFTYSKK